MRAVLLRGAGGTFCVGGDVKSMAEGRAPLPFEAKKTNLRRGMEVSRILHEMQKPVVAQVDGAAVLTLASLAAIAWFGADSLIYRPHLAGYANAEDALKLTSTGGAISVS